MTRRIDITTHGVTGDVRSNGQPVAGCRVYHVSHEAGAVPRVVLELNAVPFTAAIDDADVIIRLGREDFTKADVTALDAIEGTDETAESLEKLRRVFAALLEPVDK